MIRSSGFSKLIFFVLYFLSFMLLWEWVRPIDQITNTGFLHFFVMFAGLSLLLYYFGLDWRISGLFKIGFIIAVLQQLYFEAAFLQFGSWIPDFIASIGRSLALTIQQDWNAVSDVYRSLLFFILLWLTTYLIHYWISVRKQLFLFYLFTVIYVALLDTFSPYSAEFSIVRIILIGFLLMGMLTLQRILDQEQLKQSANQYQKWIVPLVVMIAFSSVAAYAAPKSEPIWDDPVPFITGIAGGNGTGTGGVNRLGYGVDDSQLGGSFVGDDTTVFTVVTNAPQYWRIEMKDRYTGKGWESSSAITGEGPGFTIGEEVPLELSVVNEEEEPVTATFDIQLPYNHVVYPYNPLQLEEGDAERFVLDPVNEKITSFNGPERVELDTYEWTFEEPRYSLTALRETTELGEFSETGELDQYLQLPQELPDRVYDLAEEITENEDNWYGKAKAIERYFSQNDFTYDQENIPVPGEGEDYVDQFLFDTKRGYCDNFSTSMTVLLRAVDIPARWVKGYTDGEMIGQVEGGLNEYEVTNNNAHSWVEVFFPSVGWVPFEPTIGYSSNVSLDYDIETNRDTEPVEETEPEEQEDTSTPVPLEDEGPTDETGMEGQGVSATTFWENVRAFITENRMALIFSTLLVAALMTLIYRMRFRWLPRVLILYYSFKKDDDIFVKAYMSLLKQLDRYGLKREENQTLRDYAKKIDAFFGTNEMGKLTAQYERILYRQEKQEPNWRDMRELWENLIKRTTG
ncbi:transglutaminase TgpA family protein [Jeotgalibacillus proteolyticus]|uniref:Transglutaminase n=1 Tax=Jeotgalibacillus proteolyticus TaxID=2082395 RepID=A0A2S5G7V9_9BACL|nr:transglutaminaseTgpA domain-containing protein [Jeotgalibacillus proteolyticus]PPA69014.1 transglutaminase [Jeotgalibacillus proteolyticus]